MTRSDLQAMFRAIDAADWDAVARHFHPDLTYLRPGFDRLAGRDAVLHFYRQVRSIHGEHRLEGFALEPETGAVWGRFVGQRKDGTPVDLEFADCYRFRDGLLWWRKSPFYTPLA